MPKVKKGAGVTVPKGVRATTGASNGTGRSTAGKVVGRSASAQKAAMKVAGKGARTRKATPFRRETVGKTTKVAKGKRGPLPKLPPVRSIRIRELDPVAKCGPDTSVQFLYRVDELLDGAPMAHLVFFDRHGWYCEHGRNCPAVADVRKHGKTHHLFTD